MASEIDPSDIKVWGNPMRGDPQDPDLRYHYFDHQNSLLISGGISDLQNNATMRIVDIINKQLIANLANIDLPKVQGSYMTDFYVARNALAIMMPGVLARFYRLPGDNQPELLLDELLTE